MSVTGIIILVVVVIALWVVFTYNRLVRLQKRVAEAFSDIDVQLKRRYDLIPNLVETVKGYLTHERETLQKVTAARTAAMAAHDQHASLADQGVAENMLSSTLKTLFAVSESYPDLKANQNFLQLQDEISDTENKIQASRRFYNGNVRDFNTTIAQVPTNLIAGAFNYQAREFFEAEAAERENVKVKF